MQLHNVKQDFALMPRLSKSIGCSPGETDLLSASSRLTHLLCVVLNGALPPPSPASPYPALQWEKEFLQTLADLHYILPSGLKA